MQDYPVVAVTSAVTKVASFLNNIVFLQNDGPNAVYVGGPNVTNLTGQTIPVNGNMTIDNNRGDVFCVCAAAETASVRVMGQRR